jgi:rhodanese-related sulfurtransferase
MKNFVKKNALFLTALLAVVVLIVTLLVIGKPAVSYTMSPKELTAVLYDTANQVSPVALFNQLAKGDKSRVLVDVRNSDEYAKGHIDNSVNIPVLELFQKRSLSFFKELRKSGQTAILYGEDQLQANGPWMLLKQVGFDNVKILLGGYSFYKNLPLNDSVLKARFPDLHVEVSIIDTAAFNKKAETPKTAVKLSTPENKSEKVVPVKKAISAGGGC